MNGNEAQSAIYKYPVGDQGRQFIFACHRTASRISLTEAENYPTLALGTRASITLMEDPSTHVLPIRPDESEFQPLAAGQSA